MSSPILWGPNGPKNINNPKAGMLVSDASGNITSAPVQNFIENGAAETINIFSQYNDSSTTRPVDGTGGTATNLSSAVSSTSPLAGTQSFLLTKSGSASTQGMGWSVATATIDTAYRAKVLQIEFDYIVNSGTFVAGSSSAESDVIVYLYDVTNSQLIEPSSIKLLSNSTTISDKFVANFQTSATGTSYRLILHCASTSTANYSLKLDNIAIGPCNYVYGTPITDWQSWTPTITGFGTATSVGFYWRRVGDEVEIKGTFAAGTNTGSIAKFSLPSGQTINTSKVNNNTIVGKASASATPYSSGILAATADTTNLYISADNANYTSGSAGTTWANSTTFGLFASVPIQGWSSSVQQSDGYDGRLIAARYTTTGGVTSWSSSQVIKYTTLVFDKTSSYSTSTGLYTCPSAGIYRVTAQFYGTTNFSYIYLGKNGSSELSRLMQSATSSNTGSILVDCNAGDTLGIYNAAATVSSVDGASYNSVSFEKLQAPTTISATEKVVASYGDVSGAAITTSDQILGFDTLDEDTHGIKSGTGTSTVFTIPVEGTYRIFAQLQCATTTTSGNQYWIPKIFINGTLKREGGNRFPTSHVLPAGSVEYTGKLTAGALVTIRLDSNVGASRNLSTTASANHMSITRLK